MKTINQIGDEVVSKLRDHSFLVPPYRKGNVPYLFGQTVIPTEGSAVGGGEVYRCSIPGVTNLSTEPAWPGSGTVSDGSVTWTYVGAVGDVIGAKILALCNEAIDFISHRIDLPQLEADDTVETVADQSYAALPGDYQRDLFYCWNDTAKCETKIRASLQILRMRYHSMFDEPGTVYDVAIRGSNLHYQYIPASTALETLTLHYFKKPTPITDMASEPTELEGLDDERADNLLVNYVLGSLYNKVEDGIDGAKANTNTYMQLFNSELASAKTHMEGEIKRIDSFSA